MANTFTQIYIQIVFAVKGRENLIRETFREELQKYITGIVTNRQQKLYAVYCMPDHVHLLVSIQPTISLSDLVRDIKAGSSGFVNERKWLKSKFSWQEGYGAFSYSQSQVDSVVNYILNQPEHHRKKSFKKEYTEFLDKFRIEYIEYNENYLFDWIED